MKNILLDLNTNKTSGEEKVQPTSSFTYREKQRVWRDSCHLVWQHLKPGHKSPTSPTETVILKEAETSTAPPETSAASLQTASRCGTEAVQLPSWRTYTVWSKVGAPTCRRCLPKPSKEEGLQQQSIQTFHTPLTLYLNFCHQANDQFSPAGADWGAGFAPGAGASINPHHNTIH